MQALGCCNSGVSSSLGLAGQTRTTHCIPELDHRILHRLDLDCRASYGMDLDHRASGHGSWCGCVGTSNQKAHITAAQPPEQWQPELQCQQGQQLWVEHRQFYSPAATENTKSCRGNHNLDASYAVTVTPVALVTGLGSGGINTLAAAICGKKLHRLDDPPSQACLTPCSNLY